MPRATYFIVVLALACGLLAISFFHSNSSHGHSILLDRYALEIAKLEKQKANLERVLVSKKQPVVHISKKVVAHDKPAPVSQTELMINKLKAQKLNLMRELSLYHGASKPMPSTLVQMPSVNPARVIAQSQKRAVDLKRLLRKQDALQEKIDEYDQQDDPVVQSVMAEHFTKNPGLLGRVHESTQNVLGSLAAASSPPSPVRQLSSPAFSLHHPPTRPHSAPARSAKSPSGEDSEMARLRHEISRAMRALAAAGNQPHGQVLSGAPPPAPSGSKAKQMPEVNPEEQLQGLKKLAREWIGYRGGLAAPPKPVLCPALSPRRFRGECHAEGYVGHSIVVGPSDLVGKDRFGAAGAGPAAVKGKLGDNVIGVGLLGEAGTRDDDNMLPVSLHDALAAGPSRDPKADRFAHLRQRPNHVLVYGTLFDKGNGLGDFDDHVQASHVAPAMY